MSKSVCAFLLVVGLGLSPSLVEAWGSSYEKVKLQDVSVLTLYNDKLTSGRRSAGVPQLKCVGGDAGCTSFVPQVVQCYNRGSDGSDVQWECKTDMDNAFRFGKVMVSCEGYDYSDDPYILKGSCGLEYTLDLTKEGHAQRQGGQHNYYGGGGQKQYQQDSAYGWNSDLFSSQKKGSGSGTITNLACLAVVGVIVYAIYKTCIAPAVDPTRQRSRTNDDYPDPQGPRSRPPPPPGFRPGYSDSSSGFYGGSDSCGSAGTSSSAGAGSGAGGFWTGAATGGLLGYMFGQRNNTGGGYAYQRQSPSYGFTSGPSTSRGYDSWGGSSGGGGSSSSSSGTRTASGFGGTSRR